MPLLTDVLTSPWRRTAALAAVVALAGGAPASPAVAAESPPTPSAERRNSFVYEPPGRPPRGARSHYVEAPADWLMEHMAAHLRELGLVVEQADPSQRSLVAVYAGDPREFVDCGEVRMLVDGRRPRPPRQYSANRPETRTYRVTRGRRVGLLREMRLDARVAVKVEPDGKGVRVTSDVIYVLTKTVSRVYRGGEAGPALDREVMSFVSDEIGRFRKGTSCVATGRLEDLPVLPFKKSSS
jgi:hypothetical protein